MWTAYRHVWTLLGARPLRSKVRQLSAPSSQMYAVTELWDLWKELLWNFRWRQETGHRKQPCTRPMTQAHLGPTQSQNEKVNH